MLAEDPSYEGLKDWVEKDLRRPIDDKSTHLYYRYPLIGEPIYGPIVRKKVRSGFNDPAWYLQAWKRFRDYDPLLVFCLPSITVVKHNVSRTHQMDGIERYIDQIYWAYFYLSLQLRRTHYVYTYDYTGDSFDCLTRFIQGRKNLA